MGFGRIQDLAVVTNIAPTATTEQLRTLLSIGTIREFVVYPTNDPSQIVTRVCYVRYQDPINVCVAEHLTNTVFIDRAIMVKPVPDGRIPDEAMALKLANEGHSQNSSNSGVVSQVANVNGTQSITTIDPRLNALGLPQYPPLPANLDPAKIEEIRRTVSASNFSPYSTPEQILEFFNQFGEVKFLRMTSSETDLIKSALIEFTDQSSVANALQSTGINLNGSLISINHATSGILKPHHNITHGNGNDNTKAQDSKSRSRESPVTSRRSRSQSRRSRSPHRTKRRSITPSPPRDRRRRSRSRERRRSIERKRSPSPVYGKDRSRDRRIRERSKDRDRSRRSPDRGRDREKERERERDRERDRERERERERRDRERTRREQSRDRDRERSRRKERERSRDSERRTVDKSRRRDRDRRSSRSRSKSKSPSKRRVNDFPENRMSVEMDIDENKKMEPDSLSAKSDEGGSPLGKSSTNWLAASGSP